MSEIQFGACRNPGQDETDRGPTEQTNKTPLTFDRVKLAADDFGKLSELVGNEDVAELCSLMAQLLDEVEPAEVDRLFGGFNRLAIVDSEDQP